MFYDFIETDYDHREARLTDETTGLAAYIVQDVDPMPPSDWDNPTEQDWDTYRNGDVYGVIITGPDQCHVDSLWSIYDSEYGSWETTSYTYQTAQEMLSSAAAAYRQSAGWVAI